MLNPLSCGLIAGTKPIFLDGRIHFFTEGKI